jgi:Fur family transcriptional regulator, iron response regulator
MMARRQARLGSGHNVRSRDGDEELDWMQNAKGHSIESILRNAGLRPTRQRLALGRLLFGGCDRHITAELLHAEVTAEGEHVSLATVYNTLHQFRRAGLLREIAIESNKTYFDTNTSNHSHFFSESEGRLMDIPSDSIAIQGLPEPPEGMRISHIDVVVRLVKDD